MQVMRKTRTAAGMLRGVSHAPLGSIDPTVFCRVISSGCNSGGLFLLQQPSCGLSSPGHALVRAYYLFLLPGITLLPAALPVVDATARYPARGAGSADCSLFLFPVIWTGLRSALEGWTFKARPN